MAPAAEHMGGQTRRLGALGWPHLAILAVSGWLAYRILWIAALPAVVGTDSYIRMFNRDEIVTGVFGRKWLPFVQGIIKIVYDLGGTADDIKVVMAALSTGFFLMAGAYLYRSAGLFPALLYTLLLSTNYNLMWVSGGPYQETPFYLFSFAILWNLRRLSERSGARPLAWAIGLLPLVVLSLLCRYEGSLVSVCVGLAIAVYAWRDRGRLDPRLLLVLFVLFVALPAAFLLFYTGLEDDRHSAFSRGIDLEQIGSTLVALWNYLKQPTILLWLSVACVSLFKRDRSRPWPLDHIAAALFMFTFTMIYLFLNPYVPVTNSRFRVPFAIAILGCASVGAPVILKELRRSLPPGRGRALTAILVLLFLAHVINVWNSSSDSIERRTRFAERDAIVGRVVDSRVPTPTPVLFYWDRGVFGRIAGGSEHPLHFNMKVTAYMRGSPSRVLFRGEFENLDRAERLRWLGDAGGILVWRDELGSDPVRDLLRLTTEVHGDELWITKLPLKIRFITWDGPTDESALFPSRPFRPRQAPTSGGSDARQRP